MSWTCSHGATYTEAELDAGFRFMDMDWLMEQAERAYNEAADRAYEERLAREHVLGESECPWPWYADPPRIVAEPEVFER